MAHIYSRMGRSKTPKMRPMEDSIFEGIYRETARSLWAYVFRVSGDPAVADDILQETYLRLLRSPPNENGMQHVKSYLFKIATNLARDRFRRLGRWKESEKVSLTDQFQLNTFQSDTEMMQVFFRLKKRERSILWLAYVEGYEQREIAEILNLRVSSVGVLLFRARRKLALLLQNNEK